MSNNKINQKSIWSEFTKQYALNKTLRFELKPEPKTEEFIEINRVREKDKLIDDNYHKIKYYFDLLHRKFINETLQKTNLDLVEYYNCFEKQDKKDKNSKSELKRIEEKLRKYIVGQFNEIANEWKKAKYQNIKGLKEGINIFFQKESLEILEKEFPQKPNNDAPDIIFIDQSDNQEKNLFKSFIGSYTYFTNFNNSRRNFYDEGEKDTAIANRIVNENLRVFCNNRKQYLERKSAYQKIDLINEEKAIFELDFYNKCLTQEGITNYNRIIGGYTNENGEKIKGINEKINLHRQKEKEKIPFFKTLNKQILGETNNKQTKFIEINNDKQVFKVLEDFIRINEEKVEQAKKIFLDFIEKQDEYDISKVYLKRSAINTISRKFFGPNWQYFENSLPHKETSSKEERFKLDDFISIQEIKYALCGNQPNLPKKWEYLGKIEMKPENLFLEKYKDILVFNEKEANYKSFLNIWEREFNLTKKNYDEAKKEVEKILKNSREYKKENAQNKAINGYANAALDLYRMMKYFALEKGKKKIEPENGVDAKFYNEFDSYYQDYNILAYFNEFRNYLTKKDFLGRLLFPSFGNKKEYRHPLSKRKIDKAEKIQLNFDIHHDHDWGGLAVLFRNKNEDNSYLIGIPVKTKNSLSTIVNKIIKSRSVNSGLEMMQLTQLKFKTLVGKGYVSRFGKKYSEQEDLVAIKNAKRLIEEKYIRNYPLLKEVLNKEYSSKKEFGNEINELLDRSYKLEFIKVDESYIRELESDGFLYLFRLKTKDFNTGTTGKPNLQTEYFKLSLSGNNLVKLNSAIELYFRPKNESSKHKRYREDKYFLHLSIVLNFSKKKIFYPNFNQSINKFLVNNPAINIIGIDRGENNLAYYAVINQDGLIVNGEIDSLNNPLGNKDYNKLLEQRARSVEEARQNWQTIENIKELKNGYISLVIRKICDLILKYNAIVIFEDLSIGFKRARQKIEKSVYQKLELALAKKLNYLVNKNAEAGEAGHYLAAYQLTPLVNTFSDIGKQCGIIFYTTAGYTSVTCPQCGFRRNVRLIFETKEKALKKLNALKIYFEPKKNSFCIEYNVDEILDNKNDRRKEKENQLFKNKEKKINFIVYSDVERIRWHSKDNKSAKRVDVGEKIIRESSKGFVKKYDINECLMNLFKEKNIDISNDNIVYEIINGNFEADFYKRLMYYLDILLFIRNNVSKDENGDVIDYIQCPACHFDSRNGFQGKKFNGDANGAYNIARKGILILKKLQQFKEGKERDIEKYNGDFSKIRYEHLTVDIDEWDKFVQPSQ